MKVLVTGAAGFSGSYLVEALAKDPSNQIYAVSKTQSPAATNNLNWLSCDLLDSSATNKLIEDIKPDQIYHLAAYSSPGGSFKEPTKAVNETAAIQINLLEACLNASVLPRILLISSGQIYGKTVELPLHEDSSIDCSSPYAVAKLCQENLADYYSKRGFQIVTARPFNHIGPRQRLGFIVSDLSNQIALAEKYPNNAVIKVGNLSSKRDFTDVRDIVEAYVGLMEKGSAGQIYNVCSGKSVSGQTILDILLKYSLVEIKIEVDPAKMRPSDIPDLYGDHSKLTRATNWDPRIPLEQTLKDTLEFWRKKQG